MQIRNQEMDNPTQIQIVYIGRRLTSKKQTSHVYCEGQSAEELWFRKGLHTRPEIGAIYECTVTPDGTKSLYRAEQEPVDAWTDQTQVAEWVQKDLSAARWARYARDRKKVETMARKCITPDLRHAFQMGTGTERAAIIRALIESLEKRA